MLVPRQLSLTVLSKLGQFERSTVSQHDERGYDLTPVVVGDTGDGRVRHGRMPLEHDVHFDGGDRLAAGADQVLGSPGDVVVTFVVALGELAGAIPTVHERRRGRFLIAEISTEEMRAAGPQLGAFVETDVHARSGWTHRSRLAEDIVGPEHAHEAGLGGAVRDGC